MLRIVSTVSIFSGLPVMEEIGCADEFIVLHRVKYYLRQQSGKIFDDGQLFAGT